MIEISGRKSGPQKAKTLTANGFGVGSVVLVVVVLDVVVVVDVVLVVVVVPSGLHFPK